MAGIIPGSSWGSRSFWSRRLITRKAKLERLPKATSARSACGVPGRLLGDF
jgi:hypothetical protein